MTVCSLECQEQVAKLPSNFFSDFKLCEQFGVWATVRLSARSHFKCWNITFLLYIKEQIKVTQIIWLVLHEDHLNYF